MYDPTVPAKRELEALVWCGRGYTEREIAENMGLTKLTVHNYINHARNKLRAGNRTHAVVIALNRRLIKLEEVLSEN